MYNLGLLLSDLLSLNRNTIVHCFWTGFKLHVAQISANLEIFPFLGLGKLEHIFSNRNVSQEIFMIVICFRENRNRLQIPLVSRYFYVINRYMSL